MLQTVSSLEPLEEVSYYPRGDGLADIRIRRNITTVMHGDGETAWTEYTADEAYTIRDLTEQEAIEQADSIWLDCVQASKSDSQRLAGLERPASIRTRHWPKSTSCCQGVKHEQSMIRVYARLVIAGRKTIDDVPEAGREAVRAYIAGLDEGIGE